MGVYLLSCSDCQQFSADNHYLAIKSGLWQLFCVGLKINASKRSLSLDPAFAIFKKDSCTQQILYSNLITPECLCLRCCHQINKTDHSRHKTHDVSSLTPTRSHTFNIQTDLRLRWNFSHCWFLPLCSHIFYSCLEVVVMIMINGHADQPLTGSMYTQANAARQLTVVWFSCDRFLFFLLRNCQFRWKKRVLETWDSAWSYFRSSEWMHLELMRSVFSLVQFSGF